MTINGTNDIPASTAVDTGTHTALHTIGCYNNCGWTPKPTVLPS